MEEVENPPPRPSHAPDSNSQTLGGSSPLTRRNATLGVLREASTRMAIAEAEMAKEREAARSEADRRWAAVQAGTTQLAEDTLQKIARVVGKSAGRKRKRAGETDEEKLVSSREGVLLLGLLQCNLFL